MKIMILTALLFITIVSISCKKTYPTTVINNDTTLIINHDTTIVIHQDTTIFQGARQYAISIPGITVFNSDTSYLVTSLTSIIPRFNIDYYPGIDSAFFEAYFLVQSPGDTLQVELYDITDGTPITGSLLKAGYDAAVTKSQTPGNIVSAFPHKEISLGVRIRQMQPVNYTSFLGGTLWLYKK